MFYGGAALTVHTHEVLSVRWLFEQGFLLLLAPLRTQVGVLATSISSGEQRTASNATRVQKDAHVLMASWVSVGITDITEILRCCGNITILPRPCRCTARRVVGFRLTHHGRP